MGAARRLRELPGSISPPVSLQGADYSDAFEVLLGQVPLGPEAPGPVLPGPERDLPAARPDALAWARAVFEEVPAPVRSFLRIGWRAGLGLRLAPPGGPHQVLGWRVVASEPDRAVIEQASRFLRAAQVFHVDGGRVVQATFVAYEGVLARWIWPPASLLHRRIVPRLLARAARRGHRVRS